MTEVEKLRDSMRVLKYEPVMFECDDHTEHYLLGFWYNRYMEVMVEKDGTLTFLQMYYASSSPSPEWWRLVGEATEPD